MCALAAEARHLGPTTRRDPALGALADGTLLAISGMGGEAAARGARALIEAGAGALASFGLAGGLDPSLRPGTICLPARVVPPQGEGCITTQSWRARLVAALAGGPQRTVEGTLMSCAHAVAGIERKAALFRATGAVAVDMESLAVAQLAAARGLPFIAARVIVDAAADELPPAVAAAADRAGAFRLWRLLGALALAPEQLPQLVRLAGRYRTASQGLAAVARLGPWAQFAFS